jgi:flagellar hook-length control protein FliK
VKSVVTSHLSVTISASDTSAAATGFSNAAKSGNTDSPLGAFDAILDALGAAAIGAASGGLLGALTKLAGSITAETPPAAAPTTPLTNTTAAAATNAAVMASLTSTDASVLTPPVTDDLAAPVPVAADAIVPVPLAPDPTVTVPLAADAAETPPVTTDTTGAATEPAKPTPPVQPKLLSDLVTALNALNKAQRSGEPVDDDMLKRVKQAVDAMSGFLVALQPTLAETTTTPANTGDAPTAIAPADGTPTQIPVVPPIMDPVPADAGTPATAATASVDGSSSASAPRIPLAPLARKIEDVVAGLGTTAPELSAKLTALVQSLGSGQLSADTLNALGVGSSNNPPDPKLAAAITTFVASPQTDGTAVQPQLAAPSLKLPPDSVLKVGATDGKTKSDGGGTDAAPSIAKPAAPPPAPAAGDAGNGNASHDDKGDQKPAIAPAVAAAVAQVTADKTQDPSTGANPAVPAATPVTPITQPAAAQAAAAAYQTAAPQVNLPQLAFEIVRHAQLGSNQFQIRLDPADMGRIDVKLDIASSGSVNAHLTVEHPETLDLLKRDSGALGAALSQAGLDSSKTNLEFSLRQNPFANQNNNGGGYSPAPGDNSAAAEGPVIPVSASTLYRGSLTSSGLNIFV